MGIVEILVMGLIVGALARLLIPGRIPMGILGTIAIGVAGAFLGWWIGRGVVGRGGVVDHPWIWALIGSSLLVLLFRIIVGRRTLASRRRW